MPVAPLLRSGEPHYGIGLAIGTKVKTRNRAPGRGLLR